MATLIIIPFRFCIVVVLLLTLVQAVSHAQETKPVAASKGYDLNLDVGIKYVPYLGGVSMGLSLYSPHKSLAFNLRNDILLSVGPPDIPVGIPQTTPIQLQPFVITHFHTQTYLEAEYRVLQKKNKSLSLQAGYGWIYNGINRNLLLNAQSGYSVFTTAVSFKPSWFTLEVRGDMPLNANYHTKLSGTTDRLFPVAIGIKYRFKPRKQE